MSSAPTVLFPAEHPVLAAQRAVNEILDDGVADFGVYADEPCFAWTALPDIRAIAAHILAYTTPDDLTNVLPADLVNAYRAAAKRPATPWHPNPQSKPGLQAPAHAAAAAASVTAAMDILSCSDVTAAGMAMRWLITAVRDHGLTITPTTVVSWGKNTSQTLASTQFKAIAPIMNCSSQLRYRTGAAAPRRPDRCRSTTRRIAAALPSTLWPAWWCRLGVGGRNPGLQRLALPCAVLIVGTRLDWSDAARYLGSVIGAHSAGQEIARFATGPHWPALQVALIGLSDYLADHRTAINYRRRRCLDYTGLLPDAQWGQICRHVESDAAGCVPAGLARLVLFEKITAMPARCAPFASGPRPSQATIDNAALLLTPGQMDGMNGAASEFLNSHKIREPVTWHPPVRLLNGLDLPGRDPRSINRDVLLALAAPRDLFAHQLAHRLGTDAATVRHLLDAHPAPTLSYAARVRRRSAPVMDATRSTLTPEQFVELYVNQALSLKEIAHRLGVSRKTIARFAQAEGIRLRPPGTPSRIGSVDAAWLYEQYVTRRRTLPEIGRMIGMTPVSVAHWARQFGIPLRPRGSASHAAVLHPTDVSPSVLASVPPILRPVAQRVTGLRDLQWFADASTYPTLGQAARELRMGAATLVTAVGRLERELGGRLLIRAERGRPMRLTPLGAEVAAAVNACRA